MNDDNHPRDARLAATSVLPAIDLAAPSPPAGDDFAATTLDRPTFDLEALAAAPPASSPPREPAALPAPPSPPRGRPPAVPESDAMLWIVLALLIASALGISCALAIGLAGSLGAPEPAALESDGETRRE